MERETRFELATSTLARLHSTTELLPLSIREVKRRYFNKPVTLLSIKKNGVFCFRMVKELSRCK